MRTKLGVVISLAICLSSLASHGLDRKPADHEIVMWRRLVAEPLQVSFSVKNMLAENTLLIGQPVEVSVGIGNIAAMEMEGRAPALLEELRSQGVDLSAVAKFALTDAARPWPELAMVCFAREGSPQTERVRLVGFQAEEALRSVVDVNGVGTVCELDLRTDQPLEAGSYDMWLAFDNAPALQGGAVTNRIRLLSEKKRVVLRGPATEEEKAWVLSEKARMLGKRKLYDQALVLYERAAAMCPDLGTYIPEKNGRHIRNINLELSVMYEETGQLNRASDALAKYETYVATLPDKMRDSIQSGMIRTRRDTIQRRQQMESQP